MRLGLVGSISVCGLLGGALLLAQQQSQNPSIPPATQQNPQQPNPQEPIAKSDTKIITSVNLVDVLFTVLDRRNKLVPTLDKGDLHPRRQCSPGHPLLQQAVRSTAPDRHVARYLQQYSRSHQVRAGRCR